MAGAIGSIVCRNNVAGLCNVTEKIVVMGVSGSGKSTLARELAVALAGVFIEGDEHHSAESRDKMCRGIALCDSDREPWLDRLAGQMDEIQGVAVLSCSALKRHYRERMRARVAGLRFVFLDILLSAAIARVADGPIMSFPRRWSRISSIRSSRLWAKPECFIFARRKTALATCERSCNG